MVKTLNDNNTDRGKHDLKVTWPKCPKRVLKNIYFNISTTTEALMFNCINKID